MGTITQRKRKDGTTGHTAQIRIKRDGIVVHTEAKTFDRHQAADMWLKRRESELAEPGALEAATGKVTDPPFREVIAKYVEEHLKGIGKTKAQVLRTVQADKLGGLRCSEITSQALMDFLNRLPGQPQTKGNYLSHIGSVMRVARPAWGYPVSVDALTDTRVVAVHLGAVGRSKQRTRRPTLDELDRLMDYYGGSRADRANGIPMQELIVYAIFSTRRQEEICRQVFEDLDERRADIWVRDMKHPGEKLGNDVRVTLPPEALALVLKRRGADAERKGRIFECNADSVSTSFTRACQFLEIEDLHFHDLRHDGISRLFEMGWTIPQAATVSGHRTWTSLKRYAHLREDGDKYAGWHWLAKLGIAPAGAPGEPAAG